MCGVSRKYAVSEMPQLQYEERKCAVPGGSELQYEERKCAVPENLQYKEKVLKCKERVYNIKMAINFSRRTGFVV